MPVKKLRQVFIVARDLEAQARFYRETLGLTEQFRDGTRWVQFQAGDVSLALASRDEGMGAPLGAAVPVLEVADLDATLATLTAQGHVTRGVRDMGAHGRTAGVEDPGGTFVVLFQRAG